MIYLIHFEHPIGSQRHQAQHYLGYVDGGNQHVFSRLQQHQSGNGARILAHCNQQQVPYKVVRTMRGGYYMERLLKSRRNHKRLCPICSPSNNQRHATQI